MPKQIGYVIGSLRKDSYNRKLANALIKLGPPDFNFKELRIGDLPLYNQDDDRSQAPEVQRLKSELRAVDAVMFVTAGVQPLDSRRAQERASITRRDRMGRAPGPENRPASSALRSARSAPRWRSSHLRTILAYLDMPTLGQPEAYIQVKDGFFDDAGNIANAETRKFLHGWMDKYVTWVKRLTVA